MNRRLLVSAAALALAAIVIWRIVDNHDQRNRAKPAAVPVTVAQVKAGDIPLYLTGIGTVQAYNTVLVKARVDGELTKVVFREGQRVKKGDVLAAIDDRPFQAALHTAQAALAKDEATLANAKRDLERTTEVAGKGFASRQQLDSQTALVASLTASVQADKAQVETATVQLGYTTILSPLDGRAGVRLIDQGNIVRAGDAAGLVVITQTQPIAAVFTLPQTALASVTAAQAGGAPLRVTALSRDDATALGDGTLELIDNQIDPATGTIRLKAYFPNADDKLWPGEFINARLELGQRANALSIPAQAVQRGVEGPFVYVVRGDNTVETRPLTLGPEYHGVHIVTAGLKPGETVVIDGQLRLSPGALVKVTEAAEDSAAALPTVQGAGP